MDQESHSFIVRMWREPTIDTHDGASWRGTITHVLSGEQLHFWELGAVQRFIAERVGIKAGMSRGARSGLLGLLGRANR